MKEKLIELPTLDELFSTREQREEQKLSKIRDIPICEIDDFPHHPFMVREDADMQALLESVRTRGVLTPATVRQKEDGRYELISGHRRKRACELAGIPVLRCEVVQADREEAVIRMVESNFQRTRLLPSEKAFAYKMRLEAVRRQAGRPRKENLTPVVSDSEPLRNDEKLGAAVGESREQIRRYIRLTFLIPELLTPVDDGKLKLRPAVELSYLRQGEQQAVAGWLAENGQAPTFVQAARLRSLSAEGELTPARIRTILEEENPAGKEVFVLQKDRVSQYIPRGVPVSQTEDYVCRALEYYGRCCRKGAESGQEDGVLLTPLPQTLTP